MKRASFLAALLLTTACAETTPPPQPPPAPLPVPPVAIVTPPAPAPAPPPADVPPPPKPLDVDVAAVAKKLVDNANIHERDVVLVNGGARELALLDSVAVEVRKRGANPVLDVETENRVRRSIDESPPATDAKAAEAELRLSSVVNAQINVDWVEHPSYLATVPPDRMVSLAKAFEPIMQANLRRSVKIVELGNGLFPTDALAERFGMTRDALARVFWAGVNVDYARLQANGAAVSKRLAGGKSLAISNPNGTDLRMKIAARPFVSDGVISDEDLKRGGPACLVWLPAGEVYLAPVPGTAEGKVVIDRLFVEGREVDGLELAFKAGKLTSMTARSGLEHVKSRYDAAPAGKEDFAFVDVGINPDVVVPPGTRLQSYMPAGMLTVGIGNNAWAGGANKSPYSLQGFVPGSTVTVDDKPLVDKGDLKP